jgi:molybdopterin-synthase adenylyltransferase
LNVTTELSDSERERYASQIDGDLGLAGQIRLKQARAMVIGAGTAGVTAATQLVSRGVGYVAVVDGALVMLGDLVGQALYYTPEVGQGKADTVAAKLGLLNPEVQVDSYPVDVEAANAAAIVAGHDVVLDCTRDAAAANALDASGARVLRLGDGVTGAALAADAITLLAGAVEAPQ